MSVSTLADSRPRARQVRDQDDGAPALTTSVSKALRILECFVGASTPIGVSEVSRRAEVSKSTAFRLLAFLTEAQFVERVGRGYQLGAQVLQLGRQVGHARYYGLRCSAVPFMNELVGTGRGLAVLGVLEGGTVRAIEKLHGPELAAVAQRIPVDSPFNCSAVGKVIAAFGGLDENALDDGDLGALTERSVVRVGELRRQLTLAREQGVARESSETVPGLASVAAPIMLDDVPVAALALYVPASRVADLAVARRVGEVAQAIGAHHRRASGA